MISIKEIVDFAVRNRKRLILISSGTVFLICAVLLVSVFIPKGEDLSGYRRLEGSGGLEESEISMSDNPVDFEELTKINGDICAWIRVEGTTIDYPVLRAQLAEDDDFYLTHSYKRAEALSGSVYMQRFNSGAFTDPNTVLYGHDMLDGSMFSQLKKFKNRDFFDKNSLVKIYMPKRIITYRIFSAYKTDDRNILSTFQFYDEASYGAFIDECVNPKSTVSNVRTGISPVPGDRLLTLSTCTGKEGERFVAVAVLLSEVATK